MTPDDPVTRLIAALTAAGAPPSPPTELDSLRELEEEIAPLRLPATLRDLYERIAPETVTLMTPPHLSPVKFALSGWRQNRDAPLFPVGLLVYCYASHFNLLVELDGAGVPGGTVFDASFDSHSARIRFASIDDWIGVLVTLLEEEAFERKTFTSGAPLFECDHERYEELQEERLGERRPLPLYGDAKEVPFEDPDAWPQHWHAAAEPVREQQAARGATKTVAEVLAESRLRESTATVAVGVLETLSWSREESRVLVSDRTGFLDVACPSDILGGSNVGDFSFAEFDIRVPKWEGPRARPGGDMPSDLPHGGYAHMNHLVRQMEPQAIATAIRGLPKEQFLPD